MDNIYATSVMTQRVQVEFTCIGSTINEVLMENIRATYEKTCLDGAYIKPGSSIFISKSSPRVNGHIVSFEVVFKYESYRPLDGSVIDCTVVNVTKAGIRAEIIDGVNPSPVVIFIYRDYNYDNENFTAIKEGDKIRTRVINSRCDKTDTYVSVIAELI
jgi:DNA-directed RNA polymerase subunit E'/Rpb7